MIIDTVHLSGREAYLREGDEVNLVAAPSHTGSSAPLTEEIEGIAIDVSGIHLFIEGDDLLERYPRPDAAEDTPLLSISVHKEMFPEFFADPYAHRVHAIAGFEDFNRGAHDGVRVMEVEGFPTLVSVGTGEARWLSPVYPMYRPVPLAAAAWDLATSRLTPSDGFTYQLTLQYWTDGQDVATDAPADLVLTPDGGASPANLRFRTDLGLADVIAYQVAFTAQVRYDTFLYEYQYGAHEIESLGRPLLRGVHVLEPIESMHTYYSLRELQARAMDFNLFDVPAPQRYLTVMLDFTALLVRNEFITLRVEQADLFERVEARLDAEVRLRPPMIDKAVDAPWP